MRRAAKIVGWMAGIPVGVLAIAAGALYFIATSDYLRGHLEDTATDLTGRRTQVARIAVDWGWTTNIKLEGIEVANAPWGKAPSMLKVERVDFDIRLWPLLGGNVVLPRLVLRNPEVQIETGERDQLNWSLGETPVVTGAAKALEPDNRFETPVIG